jgi:hypothetical protein
MEAIEKNEHLFDVCANNSEITNKINLEMLKDIFKPENHLGFSGSIVDLTVAKARADLS